MRRLLVVAFAVVALTLSPSLATAAPFSFTATINTSLLIGSSEAPFWLNLQLIGGDPFANTVTVNNFTFGGGSATASTEDTIGDVTGNLLTGVTLSSSVFFSDFIQQFTPGATLSFDVSFAAVNVNAPTPDRFSVAILDRNLLEVSTNGPSNRLLVLDLDAEVLSVSDVQTFSIVPEPASIVLLGAGLVGLARRFRRR